MAKKIGFEMKIAELVARQEDAGGKKKVLPKRMD